MSHGKFLATNHKSEVQYDMTMIEVKMQVGFDKAVLGLAACHLRTLREKQVHRSASSLLPGPTYNCLDPLLSEFTVYVHAYNPLLQGFTQAAFHIFTTCQALQLSP